MPRIKRWFPVSHDINSDPEIWTMRREIGEKSLSIWLEMLSIADRNESELPGDYQALVRSIAGKCQATTRTVSAVFEFAKSRLWLESEPTLRTHNHWKYHRWQEHKQFPVGNKSSSPPNLPNLSEPLKTKNTLPDSVGPSVSVKDFTDAGNTLLGEHLPRVTLPLSTSREGKLRRRLKEHPQEDFWSAVFTAILKSDFLMGRNGNKNSGWRVSFDWLIENDKNCLKIAEGQYANKH